METEEFRMGRRPLAWAVLGLMGAFLVLSIFLQTINTPPSSSSSGSAASAPQGTSVAVGSAATGGTATTGGTAAPGGTKTAGGTATTITATEKDFAITLDKTSIPAGPVTFSIKNAGPSPHNVAAVAADGASQQKGLTGKAIKESENVDANKTGSVTIDLPPGTYQIICSIPGHVQLGMITKLTVT